MAILTGSSTIFCAGADLGAVATGVNISPLNPVDQIQSGKQGVNGAIGPMVPTITHTAQTADKEREIRETGSACLSACMHDLH